MPAVSSSLEAVAQLLGSSHQQCPTCARLAQLAYFDQLTGLMNREAFRVHLEKALARADRCESTFAVLFLDLDEFKEVNDTYGHDTGDQLLRAAGRRLLSCVREYDVVARYGGDEFVVLLDDPDTVPESVLQRITVEFSRPFRIEENDIFVGVSGGVAIYPQVGRESLLRSADSQMYCAKRTKHSLRPTGLHEV